jgi:tRNA dimethylallyltransferase
MRQSHLPSPRPSDPEPTTPGRIAGVVAVVGPTAAGKSELGIELARRLHGEIVNADSMQLYRGMDVGTAKLLGSRQRGVPHHLLDIWEVTETASVAVYQHAARDVMERLLGLARTPVLVGGSGLYVRAVLDDLDFPGTDQAVRERLEAELTAQGPQALYERLRAADPAAAAGILPSNGRRIIRALEVMEITGRPFAAALPEHRSIYPATQIGLDVPRPDLDQRIAVRVEQMWAHGLVQEVRDLESAGLRKGRTASHALGYAQVLRYLAGEWTAEQAKSETIRATKRFARRQDSWFRRDPRIRWLAYDRPDLVDTATAIVQTEATS